MVDITLTKDSKTVTVYTAKATQDISKAWKINPLPSTASNWTQTTTSTNTSSGAVAIVVTTSAGFRVNDLIYIQGADLSADYQSERATVSAIAGNTLTLETALTNSFASEADVIRGTRLLSLDFNQIIETLTLTGKIMASDADDIFKVRGTLLEFSVGGGSINVNYAQRGTFTNMGITKISITEVAEDDNDPPTVFEVIVNLTYSGKARGET